MLFLGRTSKDNPSAFFVLGVQIPSNHFHANNPRILDFRTCLLKNVLAMTFADIPNLIFRRKQSFSIKVTRPGIIVRFVFYSNFLFVYLKTTCSGEIYVRLFSGADSSGKLMINSQSWLNGTLDTRTCLTFNSFAVDAVMKSVLWWLYCLCLVPCLFYYENWISANMRENGRLVGS